MALSINDDKILDILSGINGQLASLNSNMSVVLEKLSVHELRLTQHDTQIAELKENKSNLKDTVIAIAVKGLVIAIISLGTVVGAGTLIGKFFGL